MKLGKITFDLEYVVDLDDTDMVEHAKTAIYEDVMSAIKYNEINSYIKTTEDASAKVSDIAEFLLDTQDDK